MERNTLWAFGCSFTDYYYSANTQDGENYTLSEKEQEYHWLNTLNFLFEHRYKVCNYGAGGSSIQSSLNHLLYYLPQFKKGDKVIMGETGFYRESKILSHELDHRGRLKELYLYYGVAESINKGELDYVNLREGLDLIDLQNIVKVFLSTAPPSNILSSQYKLIKTLINNVGKLLEQSQVDFYTWGPDIWGLKGWDFPDEIKGEVNIETFTDWSNNFLNDYHWSPNGNRLIGYFFKDCIDNNIKRFSSNHLKEFLLNPPKIKYLPFNKVG